MNQSKLKKILYIVRDDGGCGFFRCFQPGDFLKRAGLAEVEAVLFTATEAQMMSADLVIIQNTGSVEGTAMVNFMVKHKIPFVTEYDDFVHHVSPHNTGGYNAWNPSTLFLYRSMEATRKALGVTVSTNQLAREYFPYNNNIFVVPNYLDKDKWDQSTIKRTDGKVRIGWCGGNAHGDDLLMISKVLDKIVKEYKGKVVFETMGMTRQELAGVFPLKIFNEVCPSCNYEGEIHHYPGEQLTDYPLVLAGKGWDFALAPVIDNSFGNAKSDLKIKEYASLALPVIASDVVPYREAVSNGAAVILATTFDEWYSAIKLLIEDEAQREHMSRVNKEWAQAYWIQDNIDKVFAVYQMFMDHADRTLGTKEARLKSKGLV